MRVAIVGGGPAGTLLAYELARAGVSAVIFDASHPREKPCGGGLKASRPTSGWGGGCCGQLPRLLLDSLAVSARQA